MEVWKPVYSCTLIRISSGPRSSTTRERATAKLLTRRGVRNGPNSSFLTGCDLLISTSCTGLQRLSPFNRVRAHEAWQQSCGMASSRRITAWRAPSDQRRHARSKSAICIDMRRPRSVPRRPLSGAGDLGRRPGHVSGRASQGIAQPGRPLAPGSDVQQPEWKHSAASGSQRKSRD